MASYIEDDYYDEDKVITEVMADCYRKGLDQKEAQEKAVYELVNAWNVPEEAAGDWVDKWSRENYYEF